MLETIVDSFDIWGTAQTQKSKGKKAGIGNLSFHGVNRLRELILELAVRGKLIHQDSRDEPANILLEKIEIEKQRLIDEGVIKKQKSFPEIGEDEIPFKIPKSWKWTRIANIGHDWGQKKPDVEFTYIDVSGIDNAKGRIDSPKVLSVEDAPSRARKIVKNGTVIYSTVRPYLKNITIIEKNYEPEPIASTAFAIIHPYLNLSGKFFALYFRSPIFVNYVESTQAGIAYPAINDKQFFGGIIPLPPTAEQHRIVAKVDELMALCDKLEQEQTNHIETHLKLVEALLQTLTDAKNAEELKTAWQYLEPNFDILFTTEESIDLLKQTILQLAVMGKLTSSWRTSHPELVSGSNSASALLEKIAAEKQRLIKEGKLKKQKPLPEITEAEKPFELPEGWEWSRLNDFIDVRDGTHDSPKNAVGSNTIPLITSKNFNDGEIDFNGARRISEADHIEISKRSNVEKYDILFSMIGGNLGNQVIVMSDEEFSVKNVALFKYYDKNLSFPFFIKRFMEHLALDLQKKAIGGAQPFVSLGFLRKLVIGVPPTEEQHRITDKLEDLMSLCDQLKERIITTQELKVKLADAVVEQAIRTKPEKVYEVSNNFDMAAEPGPKK